MTKPKLLESIISTTGYTICLQLLRFETLPVSCNVPKQNHDINWEIVYMSTHLYTHLAQPSRSSLFHRNS